MASSEAMTSSTRSFAYSYRLVKKCFVKICETSKCHNFLIFQPILIRFSLFCSQNFTLSSEIKLNLFRSSPLRFVLACHLVKLLVMSPFHVKMLTFVHFVFLFFLMGFRRINTDKQSTKTLGCEARNHPQIILSRKHWKTIMKEATGNRRVESINLINQTIFRINTGYKLQPITNCSCN